MEKEKERGRGRGRGRGGGRGVKKMVKKGGGLLIGGVVLGVVLRFFLFLAPSLSFSLSSPSSLSLSLEKRVEFSSSLTSFRGIKEGLFLQRMGVGVGGGGEGEGGGAYSGSLVNHSPLLLSFFDFVGMGGEGWGGLEREDWVFLIVDLLVVVVLYMVVGELRRQGRRRGKRNEKETKVKREKEKDKETKKEKNIQKSITTINTTLSLSPYLEVYICLLYFLLPTSLLSCISHNPSSFLHLFLSLSLLLSLRGRRGGWGGVVGCWVALGVCVNLCVPYVVFFFPLVLNFWHEAPNLSLFRHVITSLLLFLLPTIFLFLLHPSSSSSFLFQFLTPSLTPNMGLNWYLFSEMFSEFRSFFSFVLQVHLLVIYPPPLSVRFWREPLLLLWLLLGIVGVFQPYPTVGSLSLGLSLVCLFGGLLQEIEHKFVLFLVPLVVMVLSPLCWRMWMEESGNANFFYAITIVFSVWQLVGISLVGWKGLERQYKTKHFLK